MKLLNESGAEIAEGDTITYDPLQRGWVVGVTVDEVYSETLYTDGNSAFKVSPQPVLVQIAALEATVTPRRQREAITTAEGKAWMVKLDAQIAALRAGLQ